MNQNALWQALGVLRRGTRPHYVYFILAETDKPVVKIGTTTDPDGRLAALRVDATKRPDGIAPMSFRLLGWVEGDRELECLLHRAFHDARLVGEWFDYARIENDINDLLLRACLCRGCQMNRGHLANF
jgi:hypothetical protein